MGTQEPVVVRPRVEPGVGLGWTRVAEAVRGDLPVPVIERIWVFAAIRREEREWGTAVIAVRSDDDRVAVHTARYLLVTRGKRRGDGRVQLDFVAESPTDIVYDVVQRVQERTGDPDPPVEIDPALWFGDPDDEPSPEA